MVSELDKQVRKAVLSVKRRRIVGRIVALLRHFKAEKTEGADHVQVSRLDLYIGSTRTHFSEESLGQFHEYVRFKVFFGGYLMFEVVQGPAGSGKNTDPRLVIRGVGQDIVVEVFRPGLWMQLLDIKRHVRESEKRARQKLTEFRQQEAAKRNLLPPRLDDQSMVQRFDLKLDH